MNVLLLGGSPSSPSTTWRLLQLVGERLAALGLGTVALQVRELPAQALLRGDATDPAIAAAAALVAGADAIVVGTPVYKAAYSGVLKLFLDLLPQDGLAGKLVLPLATAGSSRAPPSRSRRCASATRNTAPSRCSKAAARWSSAWRRSTSRSSGPSSRPARNCSKA